MSPLKAIRKNCIECMGGSSDGVKACTSPRCNLFPFRFGKRPKKEGDTPRKGNVEGLKKWRETKVISEG